MRVLPLPFCVSRTHYAEPSPVGRVDASLSDPFRALNRTVAEMRWCWHHSWVDRGIIQEATNVSPHSEPDRNADCDIGQEAVNSRGEGSGIVSYGVGWLVTHGGTT